MLPLTTFYRSGAPRSDVYKWDAFVTSWRFYNRAWQPQRHDRPPETSGTLWIHRGALTNQRCSLATGCGINIEIGPQWPWFSLMFLPFAFLVVMITFLTSYFLARSTASHGFLRLVVILQDHLKASVMYFSSTAFEDPYLSKSLLKEFTIKVPRFFARFVSGAETRCKGNVNIEPINILILNQKQLNWQTHDCNTGDLNTFH